MEWKITRAFYTDSEGRELLKENNKYSVCKVFDERIGSYYIEIFGKLDSGSFVYINTNYQMMKENIKIFNSFIFLCRACGNTDCYNNNDICK